MARPIVAIVGRPNVGKSTLFNRLARERVAIVEDVPGTTRDRVYADASWEDYELTLIDTGGIELNPGAGLQERIRDQVEAAIREADVIVLVVDVLEGVVIPDLEIAEKIRRSEKPVVLAVNKADNEQRSRLAVQFYELGIGEPMPVSAFHGTGIAEVMDRVVSFLPPPSEEPEEPGMLKIAILGRPNTGKSMLLNAILGQERAIVSEVPGTTRDAIDVIFECDEERVAFVDTAGIRRRGRIEAGIEKYSVMRALKALSRADVALLVTEAAELFTAQEAHIAGYVQEALKGMVVVVNKWDLADELGRTKSESTREIRRRLKFFPGVPIVYTSALKGWGVEEVIEAARKVALDRGKRVPTSLLNETVDEIVESHPPPSFRGKLLKVSYVTQAESTPPTFVFFVNNPEIVHFSYQRYLENQLREKFGFSGVPLKLIFKRKGRD